MNVFIDCYATNCGVGFSFGEGSRAVIQGGGAHGCGIGYDFHDESDIRVKGASATGNNVGVNIRNNGQSAQPITRLRKVGRNEKCPCGSGKKYKRCCMN